MALQGVSSKRKISRRQLLKGLGGVACGAAALTIPSTRRFASIAAAAEKSIVSVLGNTGLHVEVWREWTKMVAEDSKGLIEIKYEPLGYGPTYAKIKTEAEADHHTIDIFYGDAPWPEKLANEGNLEALPYDQLPNTKQLWDYARKKFTLEVFHTHWGAVGINTKFVQPADIARPTSWEEFTNPKWKGKVGWVDPRSFPTWVPGVVSVYGEDKWIDYCRRLDKNVSNYYSRWIDARIASQKGDIWMVIHCLQTIYIGAEVDKAPMRGVPISTPAKSWVPLPVSMGLVKGAPHREAAIKVLDLISDARYTKVLMDKGLNPSNNPKNYPHPMANKIMELNDVKSVGINSWGEIDKYLLPIDWGEWGTKTDKYVKQWEEEILKKR